MREIKFRAYHKKWEEIYGVAEIYEVAEIDFQRQIVHFREENDGSWDCGCESHLLQAIGFDEIELIQYTGLTDKNGTEIYEGDILKHVNTIRYVVYEEDCGGFVLVKQFPEYKEQRYIDFNCDAAIESEIIGNIYEHPELLKDKS